MDGRPQIDGNLDALERTIDALLGMAGLADRAARAPAPVRFLLLWALRRAVAVVRAFINGSDRPKTRRGRKRSGRAAAVHLAMSLRMVAGILGRLTAALRREALLGLACPSRPAREPHAARDDRSATPAASACGFDTS
jgi:hypothetical protein